MSSPSTLPIPYRAITPTQIKACVALYTTVLERVYKATRPKANLDEILGDDRWRYETLPKELVEGDGRPLRKEELERLVKWKITHGTYRPFLPSMIAKNTSQEVTTATTLTIPSIHDLDVTAPHKRNTIWPSLQQVCKLKGVGPATGSLILSVYAPEYVPFFADELFEWIDADKGEGKRKLKYDLKEYDAVVGGVGLLLEGFGGGVEARDIERVGYVMGHLDVLSEEEKGRILGKADGKHGAGKGKSEALVEKDVKGDAEAGKEGKSDSKADIKDEEGKENTTAGKDQKAKRALKREASNALPGSTGTRRSKRNKI